MDWARDSGDWPNAESSRFIACRPHRWHVQEAGSGPTVLLLHGAFGATQSWRDLFPALTRDFHVIAPDLPGQGFSKCGARSRLSVTRMAEDIESLCAQEGWAPSLIVGHSAGAVLALELANRLHPGGVIGLNAALGKFDGAAGWLFPLAARVLALNPLAAPLLSRMPNPQARIRDLLSSTGSRIDDRMVHYYSRLATDRAHVSGTIAMMAAWNIDAVRAKLGQIETPTRFMVGALDGTVAPRISDEAVGLMPNAALQTFETLGHLMHEEDAETIAEAIREFARTTARNSHEPAV